MSTSQPTLSPIQQLRSLAVDPPAQARFAITLLDVRKGQEAVFAALQILARTPLDEARPALHKLYDYYETHGKTRDPSAFIRGAILQALRQIVLPVDIPFLVHATETYVFPPPSFKEEGAPLRSAALVALAELDETLARYHAVRLLANEHTDPMSGEPALTAAQVLAAHEEMLPLYFYVMQDGARVVPEVVSECLRNLLTLPPDLIPGIIERYTPKLEIEANQMILVGLFDLLLRHREGPYGWDFLRTFLQKSTQLDAYRYLAVTIPTLGKQTLLDLLLDAAQFEQQRAKLQILLDALALLPPNTQITTAIDSVKKRLAQPRNKK